MFFIRFLIGGFIVALVPEIAKRSSARLAGIVTLIPVITLLSLYFAGRSNGPQVISQLAHGAIVGLIPLVCFLISLIYGADNLAILPNLALASGVWIIGAIALAFVTH